MQHRWETPSLIKQFLAYASTQFSSQIKSFRNDNGAEFISLRNFFKENGVIFQHSCVYTPQQNGVVERKHRHILQVARAFRFQAKIPLKFWGESVLIAVHVINHFPTPLLSFQTPFERLYSRPPSFNHLRVFGCLAYATNVKVTHKFAPRAIKCIFIGYPVGQKAYKLYDLSNHKVFTSRDVVFHEDLFPYVSNELTPNSNSHESVHCRPLAHITDPTSPFSYPHTHPNFSQPGHLANHDPQSALRRPVSLTSSPSLPATSLLVTSLPAPLTSSFPASSSPSLPVQSPRVVVSLSPGASIPRSHQPSPLPADGAALSNSGAVAAQPPSHQTLGFDQPSTIDLVAPLPAEPSLPTTSNLPPVGSDHSITSPADLSSNPTPIVPTVAPTSSPAIDEVAPFLSESNPSLCRSSRTVVLPIKLRDYVCSQVTTLPSPNRASPLLPGPTKDQPCF
uniref:uncharacterized protein LOC105349432 n=1 Tax=Fragaria vesca subsp. vesca TaxID=101020 RepID=UPI0005CA7794|nr:PREDICTED: uncharacterized protein LOC105349432 [Fragaria vesca subsp. vesca]